MAVGQASKAIFWPSEHPQTGVRCPCCQAIYVPDTAVIHRKTLSRGIPFVFSPVDPACLASVACLFPKQTARVPRVLQVNLYTCRGLCSQSV